MPLLDAGDIAELLGMGGETANVAGSYIPCIFCNPGTVALGIESTAPAVIVATAEAKARGIAYGSVIEVDGAVWYALTVEHDGEGLTRCELTKDKPE